MGNQPEKPQKIKRKNLKQILKNHNKKMNFLQQYYIPLTVFPQIKKLTKKKEKIPKEKIPKEKISLRKEIGLDFEEIFNEIYIKIFFYNKFYRIYFFQKFNFIF